MVYVKMVLIFYILKMLGLAIATEAITEIGTSSDIIAPWQKRWRLWTYPLDAPPPENPTKFHKFKVFINSLWSCGYCFSVWVAGVFAFLGIYPDASVFICIPWWVVNWMLIHRLSNLIHILFELIKRGRIKTYDLTMRIGEEFSENALTMGDQDGTNANASDDIKA